MPTIEKLFSMKEVAEHNSADDCWIVVNGKVLLCILFDYLLSLLKRVGQKGFAGILISST